MIAVMAILLFRGLAAVVIVALAPSLGVFWTMGIVRYLGFQDNPFNDVVLPVLLSLVGLTDGVHLMVQIRRHCAAGMSPKSASIAGIREVGLACALTSLTTAIGFGSLALARHEVVHEFGWSCVVGVVLTFVAVITVIPLASATWLGRWIHVGYGKGWVDQQLQRIGGVVDWVLDRRQWLALTGVAGTLLLAWGASFLEPDEVDWSGLPKNNEAAVALQQMDHSLGGLSFADVNVAWSDEQITDSPQLIEVLREVKHLLEKEPLIHHPLSLYDLIASLPGDGPVEERFSLVELLPPPLKTSLLSTGAAVRHSAVPDSESGHRQVRPRVDPSGTRIGCDRGGLSGV